MKLTKLQRYTAYCIIIEEIESRNNEGCCSAYYKITGDESWRKLYNILPELFSKRTRLVVACYSFWFASPEERIEALKHCIIETHP
jgi:hypothetical protein